MRVATMFTQDFYENAKPVMPEAHLPFERVIELIKGASQVTFVGEVGPLCGANSRTLAKD